MSSKSISILNEQLGVNELRYRIFFSFENIYGIFKRDRSSSYPATSADCNLRDVFEHNCTSFHDVLQDILIKNRIGDITLAVGDVVCIKINGAISCFQFAGTRTNDFGHPFENFRELKKFINGEYEGYISAIHSAYKVLSVLDGRVMHAANLDYGKCGLYAIDSEVFDTDRKERTSRIYSEFAIYRLEPGGTISIINPHGRSFLSVSNALYFYYRNRKDNDILLLNRYELEMVLDYCQLKRLIG